KDFRDPNGVVVSKSRKLLTDARVFFIDEALTPERYQSALGQTSGLLLPYRSSAYYDRVSRVAIEAACLGLPMVYPANSWLEDLARNCGAGISFREGDSHDLARVLKEFVVRLEELQLHARVRSSQARAHHSPRHFKRLLFRETE